MFKYFPCRPCFRLAVVKHDEAYRLAGSNKLFAVTLVDERSYVTLFVDCNLINRVLDYIGILRYGSSRFSASLYTIYSKSGSGYTCINEQAAVSLGVCHYLRSYFMSFGICNMIGNSHVRKHY